MAIIGSQNLSDSLVTTKSLHLGRVNGKLTKLLVSADGKVYKIISKMSKKHKAIDPFHYNPELDIVVEVKPCLSKVGYLQLSVPYLDDTHTTVQLGRLVLETFVDIPEGMVKPQADHIDFNRFNNDLSNLRWLSNIDNNKRRKSNTLF